MIDLYNLEIEIGYGANVEQIDMSRGEALELIVRLRQAEKDAARYRWLRDSGVENLFSYQKDTRSKYWDEDIDAEIEAMKCNK